MLFRVSLFLLISLSISACSTPQLIPKLDKHNQENNITRVKNILDQKSMKFGDLVTIETHNSYYLTGRITKNKDYKTKFVLYVIESSEKRYSMIYEYSSITNIYWPEEAEKIQTLKKAKKMFNKGLRERDITKIEKAIELGFDIEKSSRRYYSAPLFVAAMEEKNSEMINYLIAKGLDPNMKSEKNKTALEASISYSNFGNARTLIEAGANFKYKNNSGLTPFMLAASWLDSRDVGAPEKAKEFMQYLVSLGIDPNERFEDPKYKAENALGINSLRFMSMDKNTCLGMLDKHNVKYSYLEGTKSVKIPVRLNSAVAGVTYRHTGRSKKFSIMDCRLVVSLLALSPILREMNITEVHHMRAYSHGARVGGRGRISGHHYALALDISRLIKSNDEDYQVYRDWKDRRKNVKPCEVKDTGSSKQKKLRTMICKAAKQQLYNWVITPHYNKAHHDHFHVELRDGEYGVLVF